MIERDELEQNGTSTRRIYELEARRMEMAVSFEDRKGGEYMN